MVRVALKRPYKRGLIVRLLSVPHCGTRFAMDVLQRGALIEGWYKQLQEGDYVFAHFNNKHHPVIYGFDGMPTVIPLREYDEVVKSWERRNKDIKYLESLWAEMTAFVENYNFPELYYLRIDDPEHREHDLDLISKLLDKDLSQVDFSVKIGAGQ